MWIGLLVIKLVRIVVRMILLHLLQVKTLLLMDVGVSISTITFIVPGVCVCVRMWGLARVPSTCAKWHSMR